jgi:UDP-N-acetylmuramate--alanine ligase
VVAVFQPHRYTRTQALFEEFVTSFYQADHLVVMDIYAAGEAPIPGVEAQKLAEDIAGHGHRDVHYRPDFDTAVEHLLEQVREGDLVLTLGAGNVWQVGEELARRLRERD